MMLKDLAHYLTCAILLSFAAFLCFEELVELRPCDIIFSKEMITVKIRKSKGDQLRQGDEVLIQRFLFRSIQRSKNGEELQSMGQISYSCLRDLLS